jgi:hypothetical protein
LVAAKAIPPNLLIVEDRSCSMQQVVAGQPKWTSAVQAIQKVTTDYAGQIRFGLEMFPDSTASNITKCTQVSIQVPVTPGTEPKIQTIIQNALTPGDQNYPDHPCGTPIDVAMVSAETEPAFNDTTRKSYVVLITDGKQNPGCGGTGANPTTVNAITTLSSRGVHTFVIGFGSAADPISLNEFATAGGEPNPNGGANRFYL